MADLSRTSNERPGGTAAAAEVKAWRTGTKRTLSLPIPIWKRRSGWKEPCAPKPVRWESLPKWLRLFGRIWLTIAALLVLAVIVSAWLR
jgi:hypothetical protein